MTNRMRDRAKSENIKISLALLTFVLLQVIYIMYKPYPALADESTYRNMAYSIYVHKPVVSFQYPRIYPALISLAFAFKQHFYEAMLFINVLLKTISLLVIYRLAVCRMTSAEALGLVLLLGFSPAFFMYSHYLMAENIAGPLLIVNALYHERYRDCLSRDAKTPKKFLCTVGAAFLSLCLFWSKYLLLITLPIFCIYWCSSVLDRKMSRRKLFRFVGWGIFYTLIVVVCLLAFAYVNSVRTLRDLNFSFIKQTLGFAAATGPEKVGYVFGCELKWVVAYGLYALLGSCPFIAGMLIWSKREKVRQNPVVIVLLLIAIGLVYMAARHSTYAAYNGHGVMTKLLGRYVSYITPFTAFCFLRTADFDAKPSVRRMVFGLAGGIVMLGVSYYILYVNMPWKTSEDWIAAGRGRENYGFYENGIMMCLLYIIVICALLIRKKQIFLFLCCAIMSVQSIIVNATMESCYPGINYSIWIRDWLYSQEGEKLLIICDNKSPVKVQQYLRFWEYDDRFSGITSATVGSTGKKTSFRLDKVKEKKAIQFMFRADRFLPNSTDIEKGFQWKDGDLYVLLDWDESMFQEIPLQVDITKGDSEWLLSYEGNQFTICVYDGYIWPVTTKKEIITASVAVDLEKDNSVQIYDLRNLTVSYIALE